MFVLAGTKEIVHQLTEFVSHRALPIVCAIVLLTWNTEVPAQLYGISNTATFDDPELHLITIDPATGAAKIVANISHGNQFTGLAFDGTQFYSVDSSADALYSIDFSGNASLIGSTGVDDIEGYLAYDGSSGTLFGGWRNLYSLNTSDGRATLIGATGLDDPSGMALDSRGNVFLFDTNGNGNRLPVLYSVDTSSGSTTLIGSWGQEPTFGFGPVGGLAFIGDQLYGLANDEPGTLGNDKLYTIDSGSGAAHLVGSIGLRNYGGLTFVPEPATASVAFFGAFGILLLFQSWKRGRR